VPQDQAAARVVFPDTSSRKRNGHGHRTGGHLRLRSAVEALEGRHSARVLEDEKDQRSADRSTDEYGFTDEAYAYLPVAHHMARTMMENDFGSLGLATQAARLKADA
jgi:hypothetical protein